MWSKATVRAPARNYLNGKFHLDREPLAVAHIVPAETDRRLSVSKPDVGWLTRLVRRTRNARIPPSSARQRYRARVAHNLNLY